MDSAKMSTSTGPLKGSRDWLPVALALFLTSCLSAGSSLPPAEPPSVDGAKWRWIPPGEFTMGSKYADKVACTEGRPPEELSIAESDAEEYCREHGPRAWFVDEAPLRRVVVGTGFWMMDTEVTLEQFGQFVADTHYVTVAERTGRSLGEAQSPATLNVFGESTATWRSPWIGSSDLAANLPVVHVAWEDARAYATWLSAKYGVSVRLPSECEWEYAALGGAEQSPDSNDTGRYAWGDERPSNVVANFADRNFSDIYPNWKYPVRRDHSDGYERLAPVRSYSPNGYKLYDMSGNVWEWVQDVYSGQTYSRPVDVVEFEEVYSVAGFNHVLRGGSFDFELPFLRVQKRRSLGFVRRTADVRSSISVGFRLIVADGHRCQSALSPIVGASKSH